ncbi:hypothetical protein NA56DRAFT_602260 [Hyaloscypha hepaticicola]|uniref:Uncharacterized protein n=1 Tax=Hyaloscypha hepaticicola TaxID=2082293 RepID=A0A2J6Q0N3_9HELO|nr:hypothetical protein NA56DRAFT_602260 [Hyaloscypha hepaticicola]
MKEEKEQLLDSPLRLSEEGSDITYVPDERIHSWRSPFGTKLDWLLFLLLIATNVAWALGFFWTYNHHVNSSAQTFPPYDQVTIPFEHKTVFGKGDGGNKTDSDELWASLIPAGGGLVTLPKSIAREKELWPTPEDPYNSENSIYLLSGFHHIHCLTAIRDHIWHGKTHTKHQWSWPHLIHCLDTIRQTLMCNIDTTLLGTTHVDLRVFGDGPQPHICKDFWGIKQWLTEHSPTGKIG